MGRKPQKLRVRTKVWIEDEKGRAIFGMGRMSILQAIIDHGSINAAAKALGMSYRAVWLKLNDTEKRLGKTLLIRQGGGRRFRAHPFVKKPGRKIPETACPH